MTFKLAFLVISVFQVAPWNFTVFGLIFVALTLAAAALQRARPRPRPTSSRPPEGPGVVELLADLRNAWKQETWAKDWGEMFVQLFVEQKNGYIMDTVDLIKFEGFLKI